MTEYCIRHDTLGLWWSESGFVKQWARARRMSRDQAMTAASLLTGAVITSPPEFNGHVVTWSEVRP